MKKIYFAMSIIIGICVFVSCKPIQIIYSVENIEPSIIEDSIDVRMTDTTALFFPGRSSFCFAFEITNKGSNSISFGNNSILGFKNDSNSWNLKRESDYNADSILQIKNNETKSLEICCYNIRDSLLVSILIDYQSIKKENHRLILYLDIEDEYKNKIEKRIILKPIGTRKM